MMEVVFLFLRLLGRCRSRFLFFSGVPRHFFVFSRRSVCWFEFVARKLSVSAATQNLELFSHLCAPPSSDLEDRLFRRAPPCERVH